jgi:hypothetical protein
MNQRPILFQDQTMLVMEALNNSDVALPDEVKLVRVVGENKALIRQVNNLTRAVNRLEKVNAQYAKQAARDEETIDRLRETNTKLQGQIDAYNDNKYFRRLNQQQILQDQIAELKKLNADLINQLSVHQSQSQNLSMPV